MRRIHLKCLLAAFLLAMLMNSHRLWIAHGKTGQQTSGSGVISGQAPDSPAGFPAIIRVSSNLVMVPVSVTDDAGLPVDSLQARDFKIEEDSRNEPIAKMAEPGRIPLVLALLIDISGSVNPRFMFEHEAAANFLETVLGHGDSVSIISIAAEPLLVQKPTGNLPAAVDSLNGLQPTRGMTAFYDSIVEAARLLRETASPGARRVVVVLSDGEDNNSSRFRLSSALVEMQRADCIFYAINPGGASIKLNKLSLRGQDEMRRLATETGGGLFLPDGISDLKGIFSRISTELHTQYLLGYYSSNTRVDGAFRRIVVTVPGRPDLRIRARQGYYAPSG